MNIQKMGTLTFAYDKGGQRVREEHELLVDIERAKLRMAILFGDEWVNFGRASSSLSALLCVPISRIETQFKASDMTVNFRFGGDGVSRTDLRDRHRLMRMMSEELDYLKRKVEQSA